MIGHLTKNGSPVINGKMIFLQEVGYAEQQKNTNKFSVMSPNRF